MIAALKPQNIDSMAQMELEQKLTPAKVLKKMKKSVAESTLVTTTKEAYELSVVHDRATRGDNLEFSPYDIQEDDLEDEAGDNDLLAGVAMDGLGSRIGIMELFSDVGGGGGGGKAGDDMGTVGEQLGKLYASRLWVVLTLGLCAVYFVVTGVQYWITDYATLAKEEGGLGADAQLVVLVFSAASVAGPVLGVGLGGMLIDRQGGYKDDPNSSDPPGTAAHRTLVTCSYFSVGCAIASFPAAFSSDFTTVMVSLWCVLFFGGCIVSPATGVCINAVPPNLRSFGSAIAMFLYNLLGYAAAPLVGGFVAEVSSLQWGYRTCILAVTAAASLLLWSVSVAKAGIGKEEAVIELPPSPVAAAAAGSTEPAAPPPGVAAVTAGGRGATEPGGPPPGGGGATEPSRPPPGAAAAASGGAGGEPSGPPPPAVVAEGDVTAL